MLEPCVHNTATSSFETDNVPGGAEAVDRAIRGGSFQSLAAEAHLPYKDRCAYIDVPELALRGKPALKPEEVWDTFSKEFAPVKDFFNCIQLVRPNRLRVWCPSAPVLEDILNTGLTLRGHPLRIKPVVDRCWLTVTHLPYGLPEQAIRQFFADFGEVRCIRFVQFRQVFTGTIKVLMALHKTVPTRIRVLGHAGLVYHPGQARTCFHCGAVGHESKRCPKKPSPSPQQKTRRRRKKTPAAKASNQPSSQSGSLPTVSEAVPPANDPPQAVNPNPSTPVLSDEEEHPEEFSSPKGTFGLPAFDNVDNYIAPAPAIPPKEERRTSNARFPEPPPVQNLVTNRKAARRNNPVPFVFGLDLVGSPQSTPGTSNSRKGKPVTKKRHPSDPLNQVSSSSDTGPRTLT